MVLATPPDTRSLSEILATLAPRHDRLCPRQVLGVRIGLAGLEAMGLEYSRESRLLLALVETDGCFTSGVEVATGCSVGHRTLQVRDYGKVAATFLNRETGRAFRVAPRPGIRELARAYSDDTRRYYAQLQGYQVMPADELLAVTPVRLLEDVAGLIGRPGVRVECTRCGEEVMNSREVLRGDEVLCRSCADGSYVAPLA